MKVCTEAIVVPCAVLYLAATFTIYSTRCRECVQSSLSHTCIPSGVVDERNRIWWFAIDAEIADQAKLVNLLDDTSNVGR